MRSLSAQVAERWVSVEDIAGHLGVMKDSVYRWIEAKRMPAHRIVKLWKFKLSEVDEWVRSSGANEVAKTRPPRETQSRMDR